MGASMSPPEDGGAHPRPVSRESGRRVGLGLAAVGLLGGLLVLCSAPWKKPQNSASHRGSSVQLLQREPFKPTQRARELAAEYKVCPDSPLLSI